MNTPPQEVSVTIQTAPVPVSALPPWFGEATAIAHHLRRQGVLSTMEERLHSTRRRFGHDDLIDFEVVLPGYAVSSERMLVGCTPEGVDLLFLLFGYKRTVLQD